MTTIDTTNHKDQHDRILQIRSGQGCAEDPQGYVELTIDGVQFHVNNRYARRIAERICEAAGLGAILFESSDHPSYDVLPETMEEREQLPARFHVPHWLGVMTPEAWVCAVCYDEGTTTTWPCEAARKNGGEVFTPTGEFYDRT